VPPAPAVPPPAPHDQLGVAVFRTLNRTFKNRFSLSFVRALVGGLLTFGVLPIFGLSRRFRDYISFERQQMDHLSLWLRSHRDDEDANALRDLSGIIRFREDLHRVAIAFSFFAAYMAFILLQPFSRYDPLRFTNAFKEHALAFVAWNLLLCVVYMLHWVQIRLYVRDLRRFVEQFNRVTHHEKLDPVNPPSLRLGLRMGWIATAVFFVAMGAFWGIPLALAGASQRRYINHTAQRVREQMGERVRAIMASRAPAAVPPGEYRDHGPRCDRDNCRARLPAGARFCPRCGAPVTAPTDVHFDDSVGGPA
jgi:hypothetical protein